MTHNAAFDLINASDLNEGQKSAARHLVNMINAAASTTLEFDATKLDLHLSKHGKYVSFACFADSKLYHATLTASIGPRGGIEVGTKENRFQDGGKAFFA